MERSTHILMIDDDEAILMAGKMLLKKHFTNISTTSNPSLALELMETQEISCVLLDMNYSRGNITGEEGLMWLQKIRAINQKIPVIMITGYGDVHLAVNCIKKGANDFILKPWNNEKIITTIKNAIELNDAHQKIDRLEEKQTLMNQMSLAPQIDLIGKSDSIKEVMKTIRKVAKTDVNILLLGENGTGKGLIAQTIHQLSERKKEAFIKVDLGAVHEGLFESELFGHKKGAFTGANDNRVGRFELANKGTLFLDEIGNLDASSQSKLLSVLQERLILPVGGNKEISIDIRLISATNMPIQDMVKERSFREDLLYRINTVAIFIPPLRDRKEDIPLIAEHYMNQYCKQYNIKKKGLQENTIRALQNHSWPGNIRELQHAVERAVILSESAYLLPSDFFFSETCSVKVNEIEFEDFNLETIEKSLIEKVLRQEDGNISKAAKELGLTRAALYRRLEKYGI